MVAATRGLALLIAGTAALGCGGTAAIEPGPCVDDRQCGAGYLCDEAAGVCVSATALVEDAAAGDGGGLGADGDAPDATGGDDTASASPDTVSGADGGQGIWAAPEITAYRGDEAPWIGTCARGVAGYESCLTRAVLACMQTTGACENASSKLAGAADFSFERRSVGTWPAGQRTEEVVLGFSEVSARGWNAAGELCFAVDEGSFMTKTWVVAGETYVSSGQEIACPDGKVEYYEGNNCVVSPGCNLLADDLAGCVGHCPGPVALPGGTFEMGCSGPDSGCVSDAQPAHTVTVPPFTIDATEVTIERFAAFLDDHGDNVCHGEPCIADAQTPDLGFGTFFFPPPVKRNGTRWEVDPGALRRPAPGVTWQGARLYCEWAGGRLCTEAEWELAARGAGGRNYPWGDDLPTCEVGGWPGAECGVGYSPLYAGQAPGDATPEGVLDLGGNMLEWVLDCWHAGYDGAPTNGAPWSDEGGVVACERHVLKGGDQRVENPREMRGDFRRPGAVLTRAVGFRCCNAPWPAEN